MKELELTFEQDKHVLYNVRRIFPLLFPCNCRNLVDCCFQTKHNCSSVPLKTGSTKKIKYIVGLHFFTLFVYLMIILVLLLICVVK